jgi:exonuclease SbcD
VVGPGLFRLTEQEDVVVEGGGLAEPFAYVALGHIHKPQFLGGHPHVRYSGSIERMDLGEQNDAKSVVLIELTKAGRAGEPALLPLPSTPVYELAVTDPPADLPRLRAEYADAQADLVNLHITYTAGRDNLEEVLRELDAIFPRWYARDWAESGQLGPTIVGPDAPRGKGFAETVREYLGQELTNHDEADRAAILDRAEELLKEME